MGLMDGVIQQLRSQYGPQWEALVGLPYQPQQMPMAPGAQQGGLRTTADAVGMGRTGQADPSLANIGRAAGLAQGVLGGVGSAMGMGLQAGLSQTGLGQRLGVENPFQTPTGSAIPSSAQLGTALSGVPQNPASLRSALNRELQREYDRKKRESALGVGSRIGESRRGAHGRGGYGGSSRAGNSPGGSSRGQRGE